jgi:hypothetical protein
MSDLDDPEAIDDEFVLVRWLHELNEPEPNAAVVASLEDVAEERGWHPYDAWRALSSLTAATFDPDVHPRGHDGKFIEQFGIVKLLGGKSDNNKDLNGQRGQVTEIVPDPATPGRPNVRVKLDDGSSVDVKPDVIEAAPEKARLDSSNLLDRKRHAADQLAARITELEQSGGSQDEIDKLKRERSSLVPADLHPPEQPDDAAILERLAPEPEMLEDEPVMLGGPNHTTLSTEESRQLADQVISGQPIDVNPPDVDDVVEHFADNPDPVDLTLLPQFSAMRGGGRPRSEMPQIPKEHLGTFQEHLRADGYSFVPDAVDPAELQATQSELDGKNVGGMMRSARDGTFDMLKDPIWISNDGHVLDGHHRWAAATALSTNCDPPGCVQMPVIRVDMPMSELLTYADRFNDEMGVERLGFGNTRPQANAPDVPNVPDVPSPAQRQYDQDLATVNRLQAELDAMHIRPSQVADLRDSQRVRYEGLQRDLHDARSFLRNSEAKLKRPVAAAGFPPIPDPETGLFTMATDTEDGVPDEDLANLPHGDGSAFAPPSDESVTAAALRERVHGGGVVPFG